MHKDEKQIRHESLLKWAAQYATYTGQAKMPSWFSEHLTRDNLNDQFLRPKDINPAVVILTDALNLPAGSFADIDLYKLMQVYLTDRDKRAQINELLK